MLALSRFRRGVATTTCAAAGAAAALLALSPAQAAMAAEPRAAQQSPASIDRVVVDGRDVTVSVDWDQRALRSSGGDLVSIQVRNERSDAGGVLAQAVATQPRLLAELTEQPVNLTMKRAVPPQRLQVTVTQGVDRDADGRYERYFLDRVSVPADGDITDQDPDVFQDLFGCLSPRETSWKPIIKPFARLYHCDLNSVVLRGADLQGIRLDYANLRGADLSGASLRGAKSLMPALSFYNDGWRTQFAGVNLTGADLRGADFPDSNFEAARASSADFENAHLRNSVFARADVTLARFASAFLVGASFARADARAAEFADSDLRGASFVDANVLEAGFVRANLTDVNWTGARR